MSFTEHKVSAGEKHTVSVQVEVHRLGPGPVEMVDYPIGDVLVLPRLGEVKSVALGLGPRMLTYELAGPLEDNLKPLTCYVDEHSLSLNPYPPFPDAVVYVEYDDGG